MKLIWKSARLGVILLSILIFTPVVIPKNEFKPEVIGLPYTLWVGILVYFAYVALILIGIRAHSRIYRERNRHD
jgi:Ca2+/H+ antiporter